MEIKYAEKQGIDVFSLTGRFDALAAADFDAAIEKHELANAVIIDFAGVELLTSAGIRSLIKLMQQFKNAGRTLVFASLREQLEQTLHIAGIAGAVILREDVTEAIGAISHLSEGQEYVTQRGSHQYHMLHQPSQKAGVYAWNAADAKDGKNAVAISSPAELGIFNGEGALGLERKSFNEHSGILVTAGGTAGFRGGAAGSDFHAGGNPNEMPLLVSSGFTLKGEPEFSFTLESPEPVSLPKLLEDVLDICASEAGVKIPFAGFQLLGVEGSNGGVYTSGIVLDSVSAKEPEKLQPYFNTQEKDTPVQLNALAVTLERCDDLPGTTDFDGHLKTALAMQNCKEVITAGSAIAFTRASGCIYPAAAPQSAEDLRLQISVRDEVELTDSEEYLIRYLYRDCSAVELKELTGGYSAHTFLVDAHDAGGRRIAPTVMKSGPANMIRRERDRGDRFVKPYIHNNAASAMDAVFLAETGGVRYNFVGVDAGGPGLKWMRAYYEKLDTEAFLPLLDRVLTEVLEPWYGQPVLEQVHLFRDHDPTKSIFITLVEDACKVFGLDPDQKYYSFSLTNEELINPYWSLKHEFPKRKNQEMTYYKTVVHGDLNFQNILLDAKENIYIIDFSETAPNCAVADFARIEAVVKFDLLPLATREQLDAVLDVERMLLSAGSTKTNIAVSFDEHEKEFQKGFSVIKRMREHADTVSLFKDTLLPYLMALFEWTTPVAIYTGLNDFQRQYALYSASLTAKRILELE